MARLGLGRKREEEEQVRQAMSEQEAAVVEGRDYAKNTAAAMQATKHHVVAEHPTNPFEQTAKKTDAQIIADYDAEMAARDGMAPGNPKADTGYNDISVDFSSIKSNEQAAYFASTLHDEATKAEFLKDWAKYSKQDSETVLSGAEDLLGTRLFAQPISETGKNKATVNSAMQTISSGLFMDADGNDVDLRGASLPMVIQSIRTDPDSTSRKEKVKALYTLTQTPGNRFYGMTFDEDTANTFLGGAGFDEDRYNNTVKKYDKAFYAESGHDEDNVLAYLERVSKIQSPDDGDTYSTREKRYLRAALDDAYEKTTGRKAPTDDDIAAYNQQVQINKSEGKPTFDVAAFFFGDEQRKNEKKNGGSPAVLGKNAQQEKDDAAAQQQDSQKRGEAMQAQSGDEAPKEVQGPAWQKEMTPEEKIVSQGGMSFEQWVGEQAQEPSVEDQTAAQVEAKASERESVQTPGEAMTLYLKGEALTDDEKEMLSPYLDSNAGRMLLNREGATSSLPDITSQALQKQAKTLNIPGTIPTEIGSWLEKEVGILKSGMLDDETAGAGYLALIQVMQDADAWIENGEVSIPGWKNPYNVYISTHDDAKAVMHNIEDAQQTVIRQQKSEVDAQKQADEEALKESVQRVTAGSATEEDMQRVADAKIYGSSAKRMDTTYQTLRTQLNTAYFQEEGEYWNQDSAPASEGLEGQKRDLFRREVTYQANELLNEYADVANGLGMTTEEYLSKCGIESLDQLEDMAYSRMVRQGSEFLNNPVAQEGLAQDDGATIGLLPAVGAGVGGGAVSYVDSFASAVYNMVDVATYEANRNAIMNSYNGEYGVNGRAIYREQLTQYADSGLLSEEQSAALKADIARAKDIYDVGYKIDAGWLGNGYRAFTSALDNIQRSAQDFAALGNAFEQKAFNYAWSAGYSAAGMATAGAAGALGAGGLASSALAYGTTTWNENYEENRKNGLSKQVSAAMAVGPAAISAVVNRGGAVNEGNLYGGRSLLEMELAGLDASKVATFWGKARLYAKDLAKTAVREGKEEFEERILTDLHNAAMYPVAQKIDNGQKPQFSDVLGGLASLDPAQMLADGVNSFVAGAAGSIVFSLSGHMGLAIRRKLPGYTPPCITLSEKMLNGEADVTVENIAKVTENLAQELEKPEVAQAVNEAAQQAQDAQNTVAAAMAGTGAQHFEEGNKQTDMQQTAQTKAEAAQQAADAAKTQFESYADAVMNGDLEKIKEMQAARVRMSENQKTANEYRDTAEKHQQAAREAYEKGLNEAKTRGAQISQEENQQNADRWVAEMETMTQIADIDAEIETMNASYAEAEAHGYDESVMQGIDERLHELRSKRNEIAEPGLEEAKATRISLEQALSQSEELGLDADKKAAIENQLKLAQAKERIYQQSGSDWALEEELYPGETGRNEQQKTSQQTQNYMNPEAEVQLTGTKDAGGATVQTEEARAADGGIPGRVVADTTFEEQYAPEIRQMDKIVKAGRAAQELSQALKDGKPVSQKQIDAVQEQASEGLSGLSDDAMNVFASEIDNVMNQLGELSLETDNAKARDEANAAADMNAYLTRNMDKVNAQRTYDALTPVANDLRTKKVYVNPAQKSEILHMTGFKSLPQVNRAYAMNLTENARGATPLDGHFYVELAQQSGGYMNEASLHPEEDIMNAMMARRKAYRDMRTPVEKPQDRAQIRRAANGVMEGDANAKEGATYRGIEVQQPEGKADKGTNIVKATKKLAHDIGVGSTIGARNMSEAGEASAYYREAMRYMVTDAKSAARADITMHEIGHALSEKTGLTGTQNMIDNMIAANPSFGTQYTPDQLAGEAMAEFTWRYMISDDAAKDFAGDGFFATFEQAIDEKGLTKSVKQAQTNIRSYLLRSVNDKIGAMVVNRSDVKSDEKLSEAFVYAMVDSTAPAEKANQIIREATGEKVVAFEDNLRESALLRNTSDKRAYGQMTDALTDVHGTIIGQSLKERLAQSGLNGKDFDLFWNYMLALHSMDRDKQGKAVFDSKAMPADQRRAYIVQTERTHPEFKEAAKAFQNFRHDFMQAWMVDTGYMKQWQLDMFESMYPNYVPTSRVKDNPQVRNSSGGSGSTYTIRAATGSTEQIIHPFDSFAEMTRKIVRMNMDNQTNLMFDRLYHEYDGFGVLGRPIEQTESTYSDKQTGKLQETVQSKLERAGADPFDIGDILAEIDADRARFTGAANENNVIAAQHADGSRTYYAITDPLFYKMMTNATDSGSKLLGVVGNLTHAMTALTTGSNPVFAARNFLRDLQSSVNYGTWAKSYADGLAKWIKTFKEVWKGTSEDYQNNLAQGGGGWTRIDTGKIKSAQELRGMVFDNGKLKDNYSTHTLGGKGKWAGKKLWEFATLAKINEVVEQTSRFVEVKYGNHDLTTAAGRAEAFRAGQEVTVDFSRKGASGFARDIGNVVPFFNASLQALYRTGRQFTNQESGRAVPRLVKTILNTGVTVGLANAWLLASMDDDDKEAFTYMSEDLKSKHLFIPNFAPDVFGSAPLIRIPIEQDPVAYAVNAMMTNVMWQGEADDWQIDFTTAMATIADGFNPINSTIWDPVVATQTNKNWYGSRIVPSYMESWDPSTQYTEDTAGMFVSIGRNIGVSPMMVQYVAQQYTGFLGQVVIPAMSNTEAGNPATAMLNSGVAYARQQLTSNPLKSNDVVSRVYDNSTFLTTVVKAGDNGKEMNMLRGDLTPRQAEKAYQDAYDLTHSGGALYEAKKTISEGYERINAINGRDDLTDEEKVELTDTIRRNMCRVALKANETYAKFEEAYVTGDTVRSQLMKRAYGGMTIKKQK